MTIESVRGVSDTGPDDLWSRIGRNAMPGGYAHMARADAQAATLDRGDPPRIELRRFPPAGTGCVLPGPSNFRVPGDAPQEARFRAMTRHGAPGMDGTAAIP